MHRHSFYLILIMFSLAILCVNLRTEIECWEVSQGEKLEIWIIDQTFFVQVIILEDLGHLIANHQIWVYLDRSLTLHFFVPLKDWLFDKLVCLFLVKILCSFVPSHRWFPSWLIFRISKVYFLWVFHWTINSICQNLHWFIRWVVFNLLDTVDVFVFKEEWLGLIVFDILHTWLAGAHAKHIRAFLFFTFWSSKVIVLLLTLLGFVLLMSREIRGILFWSLVRWVQELLLSHKRIIWFYLLEVQVPACLKHFILTIEETICISYESCLFLLLIANLWVLLALLRTLEVTSFKRTTLEGSEGEGVWERGVLGRADEVLKHHLLEVFPLGIIVIARWIKEGALCLCLSFLCSQLLYTRHTLYEVWHDKAALIILVMLLHPDFEDTGDADNNTDFSNNDWVKDVSVNGQFKFIVKHHDTERVANHDEYVIVEFEFLLDVLAQEPSCFKTRRPHYLVIVLLQL